MSDLNIEYVRVEDLPPATRNPKRHVGPAIEASIGRFGFAEPVVRDARTGRLVSGHGRREALIAMRTRSAPPPTGIRVGDDGAWLVPVVTGWASKDDAEAEAFLLAANQTTIAGGWDTAALGALMESIRPTIDLRTIGFDQAAIARALTAAFQKSPDEDDAPPLPAQPVSALGDLWVLGEHRIVVGAAALGVAPCVDGAKADVLWTDPPYGVSYVGGTKDAMTIQGDDRDGLRGLLRESFAAADAAMAPSARFYIAAPAGPMGTVFRTEVDRVGWRFHQAIVWVKDSMVLGHSDYHYRHEDVLYGFKPGDGRPGRGNHEGTKWMGDHAQDTVFEIPKPRRNDLHPTMKPLELVRRCLRNSAKHGDVVLDCFGGSGTTLLACEQLGLRARLVELDPRYADVEVARWESLTGKKAERRTT